MTLSTSNFAGVPCCQLRVLLPDKHMYLKGDLGRMTATLQEQDASFANLAAQLSTMATHVGSMKVGLHLSC